MKQYLMLNLIYKKDKSPLSRIKSITIPVYANQKLPVFHIVDYESNDSEHATQFSNLLDELKTIRNKRSAYKYKLGYSNFAFELWLILHKRICNFSVEDRSKYVQNINTLYGTDFTKLKDNKNKETFDKLLNQTTLENVKVAIRNSRKIRIEISYIPRDLITVIFYYQISLNPLKTQSLSQVSFPLLFPLRYIVPPVFTNSDKGKNKGKKII